MEIEISGLGTGLILLAIGLSLMGYFIGKGLQNMGHPEKGAHYHFFDKEMIMSTFLWVTHILQTFPNKISH